MGVPLASVAEPRVGLQTGDNDRFLRRWHEVAYDRIGLGCKSLGEAEKSGRKWFPYNKGGEYRKWYGNHEWVVNWEHDGQAIRSFGTENGGRPRSRVQNTHSYFQRCISWSKVTIGGFSVRVFDDGFLFDVAGCSLFPSTADVFSPLAGLLNSRLAQALLGTLAQTVNYEVGQVAQIPLVVGWEDRTRGVSSIVEKCILIAREDWNSRETTWEYKSLPLFPRDSGTRSVSSSYDAWSALCMQRLHEMKHLEGESNLILLKAYGLEDELTPEVLDEEITLYRPDREEDVRRLLSYAVGCMMGRYSLDKEGLIYAHSGNEGFDPSQYTKFPADEDGIVPVTEAAWFEDDAANRFERFVKSAWPADTLDENLAFAAESLGAKKTETPRETIRRYFASDFYKHHLQTYKNRPIYWLFSSGKQGAFEALVYLHRYNGGTLSRMRTEYVVPLLGKMNGRIGMLADTIATATSTKQRKDAEKEKDRLTKQLAELQAFDERLNHFASQRITLDLDDGVKVNYGKFGDLLADAKKVVGKTEED